MPRETIINAYSWKLDVQWGRAGRDEDPTPIVGTWHAEDSPDGAPAGWVSNGAWALTSDEIDHLIRALRRARNAAFSLSPPERTLR